MLFSNRAANIMRRLGLMGLHHCMGKMGSYGYGERLISREGEAIWESCPHWPGLHSLKLELCNSVYYCVLSCLLGRGTTILHNKKMRSMFLWPPTWPLLCIGSFSLYLDFSTTRGGPFFSETFRLAGLFSVNLFT